MYHSNEFHRQQMQRQQKNIVAYVVLANQITPIFWLVPVIGSLS